MNIPYPDEKRISEAVRTICDQALPKQETVWSFLENMTRSLGFRNIFHGTLDSALLTLTVCLLVGGGSLYALLEAPNGPALAAGAAFALSPLMLLVLFALLTWKGRSDGLYAIQMTCKYTLHHLTAYRVFAASLLNIGFNGIYVLLLHRFLQIHFFSILCISLSALFLFALLLIQTILRTPSVCGVLGLCAGWLAVNGGLFGIAPAAYGAFLQAVPVGVWLITVLLFAAGAWNSYRTWIRREYHAYG